MRVLVGMSGGVDSSVAAALLIDEGHDVVGATMKLWGGFSDSGCCSASEVNDARRVADALGIEHHVFNYTDEFDTHVVANYVDAHEQAHTPNPCVECNRHIKFGVFLDRAMRLGFDAIATGHHARIKKDESGTYRLLRGIDAGKDQSYVLAILTEQQLCRVLLPIGELEKSSVREIAERRGLRTATKPDSQDLCFISPRRGSNDRSNFLKSRIALHAGAVVDVSTGVQLGEVDAVELVTVGQRRGLGRASEAERHFALSVDVEQRTVFVGKEADLFVTDVNLSDRTWVNGSRAAGTAVSVQTSAHGRSRLARLTDSGIALIEPGRRVAPGQIVAYYEGDVVVGSGIAS